jgi:hypothetical protein
MKTVPLLFLLQLLSLPCLKGGEFCALRLSVTLPDGIPVVSAAAELLDARGTIVQTTTIANGEGHFCDFGFGPHSIRVHEESSIPTVLTGIQLIYGEPQELRVVLNPLSSAGVHGGGGNACMAYVRIISIDGKPVAGVTINPRGTNEESDRFGRLLLLVPLGRFWTIQFERTGFRPQSATFSCSSWDESLTRTIVLQRSGPK